MGNVFCHPAIYVTVLTAVAVICWLWLFGKRSAKEQGYTHPRFRVVRELFREMLQSEPEGVALAVLQKGELVVNLYGGYADRNNMHIPADALR
ncbi:unnamed protein product [Strongylus vulgaris]|uniref:Beta-lactamase-related domain-containing protein n=1 Tax=Strongylus vulgaris TaxID=40348 RepID=A0A3P7I2J3_STRVU|nr:unnamed protein product [Strongylus vulgaris]